MKVVPILLFVRLPSTVPVAHYHLLCNQVLLHSDLVGMQNMIARLKAMTGQLYFTLIQRNFNALPSPAGSRPFATISYPGT